MKSLNLKISLEMNKNQWLCYNCIYSGLCNIESQANTPIYHCEEHFVKGSDEKPFVANNSKQTETTHYIGLCSSCDHKENCALRRENEIIINCEHYQ